MTALAVHQAIIVPVLFLGGLLALPPSSSAEQPVRPPSEAKPSHGALALYVAKLGANTIERLAAEPAPGFTYCGSPCWSADGERILCDATPGRDFGKTRMFSVSLDEADRGQVTDLGPGNAPHLSSDGTKIAFLWNGGPERNDGRGVWMMNADGSNRKRLGAYGLPKWSPDGKQILVVSFSSPCQLTLLDVESGNATPVVVEGHDVYSVPSWTGDERTLAAVVRSPLGVSIALVDLTTDGKAYVIDTAWRRSLATDPTPFYPTYSSTTRQCLFSGRDERNQFSLLATEKGSQKVVPHPSDRSFGKLASLALSPDGKHVAFAADASNDGESSTAKSER